MKRLNARQRDILSGVALAGLAVAYFVASGELPVGVDEPGPRFFPHLLALILFVLGLAIASGGTRKTPPHAEYAPPRGWRPAALAGATFVFVALVSPLGLLPAAFLLALAIGLSFGGRVIPTLVVAAVSSVVVYGLFSYLLEVPLP